MVTPPRKDGTANPDILTAAAVAGVDRVFLLGGAQAVAALAYGTLHYQSGRCTRAGSRLRPPYARAQSGSQARSSPAHSGRG